MDGGMWMKITLAVVMGYMLVRLYPAAKHWLQNGPRGSSSEWLNFAFIIGCVVLFVLLLMSLV